MANRFDDDGEPVNTDGATVQMSGEALARLHRELEQGAEAKRASRTAATDERSQPPAAVKAARGRAPAPVVEEVAEEEAFDEASDADDPDAAYARYGGEIEDEVGEEVDAEAALPTVKAAKPPKAAKPEKAPKPPKPAPAPKPPKPAKEVGKRAPPPAARGVIEVSEGGGALCVLGGVGALLIALATLFQALATFGALGNDPEFLATQQLIALIAGIAGHVLLFMGMLGAARATNGLGVLVGIFHLVTVLVTAFLLLLVFGVLELDDPEMAQTIMLIADLIGPTTWLLSGIWGFASSAGMGAGLAVPYGILALLGGAGLVFSVIGPMINGFDPELAGIIDGSASAALAVATILLSVAMFGPLRRGRG